MARSSLTLPGSAHPTIAWHNESSGSPLLVPPWLVKARIPSSCSAVQEVYSGKWASLTLLLWWWRKWILHFPGAWSLPQLISADPVRRTRRGPSPLVLNARFSIPEGCVFPRISDFNISLYLF